MRRLIVASAVLAVIVMLTMGASEEPVKAPFEGAYLITGDLDRLLEPGAIQVTGFYNPTCTNCYLFHKYSDGLFASFGDKISMAMHPYMHKNEGEEAVRLILVAEKHGKQGEAMAALFEAKFVSQVDIDDPEIVGFVAQNLELADQYAAERDGEYVQQRLAEAKRLAEENNVHRTPCFFIQHVLQINSGTCKCQGDTMPQVVEQTINNLIEYRKTKGIQP